MIQPSELIINPDGTLFHLHITEAFVADTVILVGDPARADMVSGMFDSVELSARNREFVTHKGTYNGRQITVISTGIGCDNIDIVMTELDAAVNVDLATREVKAQKRSLRIVRLGTSGAVQPEIKIGDYVMSEYSVGIDGLAHFYSGSESVRVPDLEQCFSSKLHWREQMAHPYAIRNDQALVDLYRNFAISGITISAGGFYAPQGRSVRLAVWSDNYMKDIEDFRWNNHAITNFEMEGSAIALLGALLGHKTLTVCAIIAQRTQHQSNPNYSQIIENLIRKSLELLLK